MTSLPAKPPVKIWPLLGLSAIKHRHGGAWRAWTLARALDGVGSGKVLSNELNSLMRGVGVESKTRRRWMADALKIGLLIPGKSGALFVVGLARAAALLNSPAIGLPAMVDGGALVRKGWRALTFEAYNSTLRGPMSQNRKHRLTRISPRTQRNYIRAGLATSRRNFAIRNEPANHASGIREVRGLAVFSPRTGAHAGKLIQRLPDWRIVPQTTAIAAPVGRSRKAQRKLLESTSCTLGRGNVFEQPKLFYGNEQAARRAVKAIERSEADDRPGEVFELMQAHAGSNLWRVNYVQSF